MADSHFASRSDRLKLFVNAHATEGAVLVGSAGRVVAKPKMNIGDTLRVVEAPSEPEKKGAIAMFLGGSFLFPDQTDRPLTALIDWVFERLDQGALAPA